MTMRMRSVPLMLCVLVFLVGAGIRILDLSSVGHRSPDETTYASQAKGWTDSGIRSVADNWERHPELAIFPSPVRVGFLLPLRIVQTISGDATANAGADLSCIASILCVALIGLIAWSHLSHAAAPVAMALFAVCPPELMAARRGWMESFTACLGMLVLLLLLECLRKPASLFWLVAAGAMTGLTITVKETSMSQSGLLLLLLCIELARQQRWREIATVVGSAVVTTVMGAWWVLHSMGGYSRTAEFFHRAYAVVANEPYSRMYESGSTASWIKGIWIADPLLVSLAVAGIALLVIHRNTLQQWSAATALLCFELPLTADHRLNLRIAALGWAPLCFLGAAAAMAFMKWLKHRAFNQEQRWLRCFAIATFCVALVANYLSFRERFLLTDLQDLSLRMVLNNPLPVIPDR